MESCVLSRKSGKRSEVFAHGRAFFIKIIEDNAISYVQDKNSPEWTFNYYTKNARSSLTLLNKYWDEDPGYKEMTRPARERWNYCQELLDTIINFEKTLVTKAAAEAERATARKVKQEAGQRRAKSRAITLATRLKSEAGKTP